MLDKFVLTKAIRILASEPNQAFSVRGFAKKAKISPAAARTALGYMHKKGIASLKIIGKTHQYKADLGNPLCRQWKIIFNIDEITDSKIIEELKKRIPELQSVLLYGSFAKGTNDEKSDVDLLVIAHKPKKIDLSFANKLGREANISIISISEWKEKAKKDRIFYENVIYDSIVLFGERPVVL